MSTKADLWIRVRDLPISDNAVSSSHFLDLSFGIPYAYCIVLQRSQGESSVFEGDVMALCGCCGYAEASGYGGCKVTKMVHIVSFFKYMDSLSFRFAVLYHIWLIVIQIGMFCDIFCIFVDNQ